MLNIQHYNVSLNVHDQAETFKKIGDIITIIRPQWTTENLQFNYFTEGLTNKLLCCSNKNGDVDDRILFTIYGENTQILIDRETEVLNIHELSKHGLAAPIYCTYTNGLAYKFTPGIPLDVDSVRDEHIAKLVSKCLAELHSSKLSFEKTRQIMKPSVFVMIEKFIDAMPDKFTDQDMQRKYESQLLTKSELKKEYDIVRQRIQKLKSPIVFCHNDCFSKNFIYDEKQNFVKLIDFEYCGYNYQAYDLADHFTEYAGTDNMDFSRYPNKEYQLKWLKNYLTYYHKYINCPPPTDKQIETLYIQTNVMAAVPHFVWSIWAVVQAQYSSIDFDYMQYAVDRLNEYYNMKEKFWQLEIETKFKICNLL